jgi:hypothetical protein
MTTKEALHRLIDELPEKELLLAQQVLLGLRDRTVDLLRLKLLMAPYDNEVETKDEGIGAQEAREQIAVGDDVTNDELRYEIGW